MIINHQYKFIFVKTRKTAGTSIEIALSDFCSKYDTITPIAPEDERTREGMGFAGPQNYYVSSTYYSMIDWLRAGRRFRLKEFQNHSSAAFIRQHVSESIWNEYFKFCVERNPYDKAISRYYWSTEDPRPNIKDFLENVSCRMLSDWESYAINDHIAVDFVAKYENLAEDLKSISDRIGLPNNLELPNAKSGHRLVRKPYRDILCPQARSRIELVCAKEIYKFGYRW